MDLKTLSNEKYFGKLKEFVLILFSVMLMGRFVSLYWILPHSVDALIFMGISVMALVFVGMDLLSEKKILKVSNIIYLAIFFVSCVISCLLFMKYGWFENLKALISIAVSAFFLYPFMKVNGEEKTRKIIVLLQKITVCTWLVLSLISIGTFFVQYSDIFYMHGTRILLGCIENRLFGMFSDPNYASIVSILTVIFSVAILNYENQGKFIRRVSVTNIVIQFFYIVLGASRTGEVCLLLATFFVALVFSYKIKPQGKFYFLIIRILAALAICVAMHYVIEYTRVIFSYIPSLFEPFLQGGGKGKTRAGFMFRKISMERPDVAENSDISNLRFRIWASAVDIFKTSWFFGVSPRNALSYAKDVLPNAFIAQRGYDAHNFYVATLLYTGISGSVVLGIFLIKSAYQIIMYYIKNKFLISDPFFNSMVISVLCVAASGMFLSEILFITTVGSFFFWLFLGSIFHIIGKENKSV